MSSKVEFYFASDTGLKRKVNEDNLTTNKKCGFFVLADGMGGHNAGEVASAMAVHLISTHLMNVNYISISQIKEQLRLAINDANQQIYNAGQENLNKRGMGTTVVVGVFHNRELVFGHVGDSRLYQFRAGLLKQLTEDHSLIQEMKTLMTDDEQLKLDSIPSNIVTQALGANKTVQARINHISANEGDLFLSCSDGLYDMLDHITVEGILRQKTSLSEACIELINQSNERGGLDNISVVIAKPSIQQSVFQKMLKKVWK